MIMEMQQHRISYLLEQYALLQISSVEETELWALLDESQHDEDVKNILLQLMQSEQSFVETDREKWEPVLNKVLANEEEKKTISILPGWNQFTWKKMAAAAVIFLFAGTGLYYLLQNENSDNQITVEKTNELKDVAAPNTVNATLTLSNGMTIVLDSAGNGILAQQGDVNVMKLSDGQIVYDPNSLNINKEEISYNTLSNPRGSKAVKIVLADGTKVWLNAESSLHYPTSFIAKERRVNITGEAYFEVAHKDALPFYVSVDGMEVEVLGTHFNINSYKEENILRTTLLEGSVKVSKGERTTIIKPGQQAQVSRTNNNAFLISKPDLDEVMAWKEGRFTYNNMDLGSIMRDMARWYNVEVVYKDIITDRYTVNVSRDVPVSQLFKFIEMSGGVKFEIRNNIITVKK
jgi:hypothetical protein